MKEEKKGKILVIDEKVREKAKKRVSLTLIFAVVTFCLMLLSLGIAVIVTGILMRMNLLSVKIESSPDIWIALRWTVAFCLLMGIIVPAALGKIPLRPINELVAKMRALSSGDFSTRLHFKRHFRASAAFAEIEESFNAMAEELENTEMLRSDFINNLSHEFKTPIVSIAGFAKLLKRGNLTQRQQAEYIAAIEEESLRLSAMATNVLNLTKIENQTILTDRTWYNVSEQIRSAVLLLETAWMKKHLELHLDFSEHTICANEEMLKQVWINLIDNAVKFSPEYAPIEIGITEQENMLTVTFTNSGEIPSAAREKIWNKFYQADESHSAEGSGVGLAIVRRIVDLHGGNVTAESANDAVTFTVKLPVCKT